MRLLVTGGAGFIGSNFVRQRRFLYPAEYLVVLDALTYAGCFASIDGVSGLHFVHGDIRNEAIVEQTLRDHEIDTIVHFAAESHVDKSISGPFAFVDTNVKGSAVLFEKARQHGIKRFMHVSTDEVYGHLGPSDPPFTESTHLAPRSPYAASKAGSDLLARAYFETYGFPVIVTRCSNNYGPYQHIEKLIPLMISNALSDKPLPVYGDGQNVRDWIHVEDHCSAISRLLELGRPGEIYNISGRAERKNIDIVWMILHILGKPESLIRFVTDRLGHDRRYAVDDSKTVDLIGSYRSWSFSKGLRETIKWYIDNEVWWRGVLVK